MRKQIIFTLEAFVVILVLGFWVVLGASSVYAQGFLYEQIERLQGEIFAQQSCLSDVQIQQSVGNSSILPLSEVLKRGGVVKNSKVLPPISVCSIDGKLFYKFSILSKDGNVKKLTLPATLPIS